MNKILLKGHLGQDPEVKTFDWGKTAKFSLATNESYKNKQGEKITETDWHNCIFRGSICEIISQYLHKGDEIIVEGKIKYRSYKDKEGVTKFITEIICHAFEFCGTKERVEQKPEPKSNKIHVDSMSDINELPGNVANYDEIPDDTF